MYVCMYVHICLCAYVHTYIFRYIHMCIFLFTCDNFHWRASSAAACSIWGVNHDGVILAAQQVLEQTRCLAAVARGVIAAVALGDRGVRRCPFAGLPRDGHGARLAHNLGLDVLRYTRDCTHIARLEQDRLPDWDFAQSSLKKMIKHRYWRFPQ